MKHSSSVGVLHAQGMAPDGQALPQYRLSLLLQALGLQRDGHLPQSVSNLGMIQPQGSFLDCQTALQRLVCLQRMNMCCFVRKTASRGEGWYSLFVLVNKTRRNTVEKNRDAKSKDMFPLEQLEAEFIESRRSTTHHVPLPLVRRAKKMQYGLWLFE